ncbi:acylneuraminate cytidylyltransferase family protein [uncultured Clostridium sp.]|uniref:acylneuraminate cytidylyltransferase family protein n=1 Tax=uncultured Clostridium sp. TaxID=59620 RepID=UPI003217F185
MNKEILAIIPARGGSKGVPRKNVRELNGRPLIGYTIEAAKKSNRVSRVVVTTEDIEIATVSREYKAEVPYLRPDELSQDNSPTMECVLHMLNYLEKTEGYVSDYVLLLQCTSPLRNHSHINEAIDKLLNSDYDSIVSVCEAEVNPYWANIFEGDKLKYFIEEGRKITRRQELPNVYRMNGAIYLIKTEVLKKQKTFEPEEVMGYIMDSYSSVDIDTEMDFKIAEAIIKECGDV